MALSGEKEPRRKINKFAHTEKPVESCASLGATDTKDRGGEGLRVIYSTIRLDWCAKKTTAWRENICQGH